MQFLNTLKGLKLRKFLSFTEHFK